MQSTFVYVACCIYVICYSVSY